MIEVLTAIVATVAGLALFAASLTLGLIWLGFALSGFAAFDSHGKGGVITGVLLTTVPAACVLPAWWVGIPPESPYWFWIGYGILAFAGPAIGFCLRLSFLNGSRLRTLFALSLQAIISTAILVVPFVQTALDARLAALGVRAIAPATDAGCGLVQSDLMLVHASDLHITAGGKPTKQGEASGNARLEALARALTAHTPQYAFFTGDLTDTGSPEEWRTFVRSFEQLATSTSVVITPGNHDVNLAFGDEPSSNLYTADFALGTSEFDEFSRLARVLLTQATLNRRVESADSMPLANALERMPQDKSAVVDASLQSECFADCRSKVGVDRPAAATAFCRGQCSDWRVLRRYFFGRLSQVFPLTLVDTNRGVALFSLATTMADSASIGRNAIGRIGVAQVDRLRAQLAALPRSIRTVLFAFHHPVTNVIGEDAALDLRTAFHTDQLASWSPTAFLAASRPLQDSVWWARAFLRANPDDSKRLLAIIHDEVQRRGIYGVVLFGHRHRRTLGQWDNLTFVEAPSLPAEAGFYRVTLDQSGRPTTGWCSLANSATTLSEHTQR